MPTVKEYIKDKGYAKGTEIKGPDGAVYVVGTRGRAPRWLSEMAGAPVKVKDKKAAKRVIAEAAGNVSKKDLEKGAYITLTNGSFLVNGKPVVLSGDAEALIPVGAVISGPC